MTFEDFNFEPELLEGLLSMGFKQPTPIQEQAIPIILANRDIIACAQTGTGKTAAYLLPLISKIIKSKSETVNTLIIVPTRELAIQIDEAIQGFTYFAPVSALAIFGGNDGASYERERKALIHGANIIIATPGRLISHLNMGYVKFDKIEHLVLDEADRMLDMGFNEDISKIITHLPKQRQSLLFSATMPHKIRELAKKILNNPEQINIALSKPAEGVTQSAYVVYNTQKMELLKGILQEKRSDSVLIFSSTKDKVKEMERELHRAGINVAAIHSDLEQDRRNEVIREYKGRKINVLVATDILSRGIDIDSIGLVINYDVPRDAEDYIHRVGRTARAESTGEAITFINPEDQYKFKKIEDLIGNEIKKLPIPEKLGAGPEYNPQKNSQLGFKKPHGGKKGSSFKPRHSFKKAGNK
ncbi:MAG TPA: DEAD/DEAH box helicase [Bacteroidia bacterium]|nr:DEAD/DEAH box helicase [Bacteroidia bacterium]